MWPTTCFHKVLLEHNHVHSFMYVYNCFSTTMAELSICHRDRIAQKASNTPFMEEHCPRSNPIPSLKGKKIQHKDLSNWHNNRDNHFHSQDKLQIS